MIQYWSSADKNEQIKTRAYANQGLTPGQCVYCPSISRERSPSRVVSSQNDTLVIETIELLG